MKENTRTVIRGFYNRDQDEEECKVPEVQPQEQCEPDEVNVTWIFWLLGGLSVASLAMSIISLVISLR